MTTATVVTVELDDRLRLIAATLAATHHPADAQARKRHGIHAHARLSQRYMAAYQTHPAVLTMKSLLMQDIPLAAFFSYGLHLQFPTMKLMDENPRWMPSAWPQQLADLYVTAKLDQFWRDEHEPWQMALSQCQAILSKAALTEILSYFVGPISETLKFMPNLCFPADQALGLRASDTLVTLMPPPQAWGDSAPWSYRDDPALVYRAAIGEYAVILIHSYLSKHPQIVSQVAENSLNLSEAYQLTHPTWQDQFLGLFKATVTALFLEQAMGQLEARSYIQHMQRVEHLTQLQGAVTIFKRYLNERGSKYQTFIDFLPSLPKLMRAVKLIGTA